MAMEAAKEGKWEKVAQLYDARARAGSFDEIPHDVVQKIMEFDQWIMTRIREVQALSRQQLGEAQQHRRHIEGLKRRWAGHNLNHAYHRLTI